MIRIVVLLSLVFSTSACIAEDSVTCPAVVKPAIRLFISVPDPDAHGEWVGRIVVRSGSYIEVLHTYPLSYTGDVARFQADAAPERPGIYSVSVRRTGYEDWGVTGVVAPPNDCGVTTQRFNVELNKLE